jgi:hypothetical protein
VSDSLTNYRVTERGCHEYLGAKAKNGYAKIGKRSRQWLGHRLAWTLKFGEIPGGLFVLHKCDNRPCINPDHLFLGTAKDNTRDMMQKGRACFNGGRNPQRGSQVYNAVLDERKVALMRRLTAFKQKELAAIFGVSFQSVSKVLKRECWKHV